MPFNIPNSWTWVRLGSIANIYNGNSINKEEKKRKYTNVKGRDFIATKDIGFDKTISYNNGIFIPYGEECFKVAPSNKILLCIEGGSAGRKIAITDREVCFGNKLACFDTILVNDSYLYNVFQSTFFTKIFCFSLKGIIGGVSINALKDFLLPLPPIKEQEKIAKTIEIIDNNLTIVKNEYDSITKLIEVTKKKILEDIFGDNSSYKSYYTNKKLSQVSKIVFGQSPSGKDIIPSFSDKGTEFHQGKLSFGIKYLNNSKKYCVNPKKVTNGNSILMSVRAPVGDINLCNRVVCIGRGLCSIEPEPSINIDYLFYYLLTQKNHLLSGATGSTFSAIKSSDVKNINVPICSLKIQSNIVMYIKQSFTLLDALSS